MTRTERPCASPRAPCCAELPGRVDVHVAGARFEELRELCAAAGDKASLAIAMAGLVMDHAYQDRMRQASQLASEAWAFIESIGDATLTVGPSLPVIYAKGHSAEFRDVLGWSQRVIDLADGDPSKGNFVFGCPLALAFATPGFCPVLPGSSRVARPPAAWPGHGPQRRSHVTRRGGHLRRQPPGNTEWRAPARRFRGARDRGCPKDCRTIR